MNGICEICGNEIPINRQNHHSKTCSDLCRRQVVINKYHSLNPQSLNSRTASGAIGEYKVIIDLLCRGFEVFRSVEPGSNFDLAIFKDGKFLRVEVKCLRYSISGKPYSPHEPIKADILAGVMHDTILYTPSLE